MIGTKQDLIMRAYASINQFCIVVLVFTNTFRPNLLFLFHFLTFSNILHIFFLGNSPYTLSLTLQSISYFIFHTHLFFRFSSTYTLIIP